MFRCLPYNQSVFNANASQYPIVYFDDLSLNILTVKHTGQMNQFNISLCSCKSRSPLLTDTAAIKAALSGFYKRNALSKQPNSGTINTSTEFSSRSGYGFSSVPLIYAALLQFFQQVEGCSALKLTTTISVHPSISPYTMTELLRPSVNTVSSGWSLVQRINVLTYSRTSTIRNKGGVPNLG